MGAVRLGIVGVGRHGSRYARHAAGDVEGIELAAVCRRNRSAGEAVAEEFGCDFTTDAYQLIRRDDIDAVALVTVPDLLEDLVAAAVDAGKALLIEKPVAPDLVTGRRILALLEDSGAYCMAGHTLRFNTVCLAMRERIGGLGRIDSLLLNQTFAPQLQIPWIDDPLRAGGGNILHTGVHCFDLIRFLTGWQPETVHCRTRSVYTAHTEDLFVSDMSFCDAAGLASVSCSRTTQGRAGLIDIVGENGRLVGDHAHNTLARISAEGREEIALEAPRLTVIEILRRLERDLRESAPPAISYRDGLAAVAVAEACYRSSRSGRQEDVERL